jgi:hypothetical protein
MSFEFLNGIRVNNQRITDVGDPSVGTDAVNKQFVENYVRGIIIKGAVQACAPGNVNLAAPGASIDGVDMVTAVNKRFLAPAQTVGPEKGIYDWNGPAVPATRSSDADDGSELKPGTMVYVIAGTPGRGDKTFVIISNDQITIGTSDMIWDVFGGGTAYSPGGGIQIASNIISVVANTGIIVNGSGVGIDGSVVSRKREANIGNGSATALVHAHFLANPRPSSVMLFDTVTNRYCLSDCEPTTADTVTWFFPTPPAANRYVSVITG